MKSEAYDSNIRFWNKVERFLGLECTFFDYVDRSDRVVTA